MRIPRRPVKTVSHAFRSDTTPSSPATRTCSRRSQQHHSGKMEGSLTLLDCHPQLLLQHLQRTVIRHLQVVDASHDAGQIIVRRERWLRRLAHHGEHRGKSFETYQVVSTFLLSSWLDRLNSPPIGNFGLPVTNCKKSLLFFSSNSEITCSKFLTLLLSRLNP